MKRLALIMGLLDETANAQAPVNVPTATRPTTQTQTTQTQSTQSQSTFTDSGIAFSDVELAKFKALGLTESDYRRYQTILTGARGNWSEDKDPIMVLGVTADTETERTRYANVYVENDRKRNAAILEFTRATQRVWLEKYANEPLFTVPGAASSPVPLLTANDRVILVIDASKDCPSCIAAFENVQRLGRANGGTGAEGVALGGTGANGAALGGTGIDIYFVASNYEQMVAFGRARGMTPADVSAKRVTLNQATPAILTQLQVTAVPAAFKRTAAGITRIDMASLLGAL